MRQRFLDSIDCIEYGALMSGASISRVNIYVNTKIT